MASNLKNQIQCDILICGAGLAGLSLAYRALKSGIWSDQRILIVDSSSKSVNDKTWSFWRNGPIDFEDLIFKSWDELSVYTNEGQKIPLKTDHYSYNSIRSIDFYNHTFDYLSACKNVQFFYEDVLSVKSEGKKCLVETNVHQITATYTFNSIFKKPFINNSTQYFLQHFKGIVIKSPEINFDPKEAYLMDFRTGQEHGTTFLYVLPMATDELFIEYTIFSKVLLRQADYDEKLALYIKDVLDISTYEIISDEFGVIPMTDHRFTRFEGNIVNMGTIGGDTRGATGYTFSNIQKTVSNILKVWKKNKTPFFRRENINLKHHIYDATLLNVLNERKYFGHTVFADLFRNTDASNVFAFLDAETNIIQDVKIIKSLRPGPFIRAMIKVLRRK